jgi:hypothetical protein
LRIHNGTRFTIALLTAVLLFVAVMIIALVILDVVFANSIYKAVGFSFKNPLFYAMTATFVFVGAFKVTYLWRFRNSIGKQFRK